MNGKWISIAMALAMFAGAAGGFAATQTAAATTAPKPVEATAPLVEPAAPPRERAPHVRPQTKPKQKLINVNAASRQQLKGLPGGSDEEADRIIAGRPFNSKAFLLSKNIVSAARFDEIRGLIVAGKPAKAGAAKK